MQTEKLKKRREYKKNNLNYDSTSMLLCDVRDKKLKDSKIKW